ncbi:hypothetical protein ACA910_000425 [Epithemia clementina (nom. ined.)]
MLNPLHSPSSFDAAPRIPHSDSIDLECYDHEEDSDISSTLSFNSDGDGDGDSDSLWDHDEESVDTFAKQKNVVCPPIFKEDNILLAHSRS